MSTTFEKTSTPGRAPAREPRIREVCLLGTSARVYRHIDRERRLAFERVGTREARKVGTG